MTLGPRERRLLESLADISRNAAELYLSASRLVRAQLGAAQGLALAHLLRELILAVESPVGPRVDYASRLTRVAKAWPRSDDRSFSKFPSDESLAEIRQLVADHQSALTRESDFARLLARLDPGAFAVTPPGVLRQWTSLRQRIVAIVHAPRAGETALPSPERAAELYEELTDTLFAFLSPFFDTIAELDALLALESPTGDDARRVAALLKLRQQHVYFFERAGPSWAEPLAGTGTFFRDAPAPIRTDQGFLLPDWPDSRYLARVAAVVPTVVAGLLGELNVQGNPYVVRDAIQALRGVGVGLSAALSKRIPSWSRAQPADLYAMELAELGADWADAGHPELGITALRTAIRTVQVPGAESDYAVGKVLGDPVDRLSSSSPGLVADVLLAQLRRTLPRGRKWESTSRFWRRRMARASRHDQYEAKNLLVDALIRCFRMLSVAELTVRLSPMLKRPQDIYPRLVLYAVSTRCADFADLTLELLSDPGRWDAYATSEEFRLLIVAAAEAGLISNDYAPLLDWLRAAAPAHKAARTDDELAQLTRRWRGGVLARMPEPIRTAWLSALGMEAGSSRQPGTDEGESDNDEEDGAGVWVGPTSPVDAAALGQMEPDAVAQYLRTWQSSGGFMSPTPEGLGRQLAADVAQRAASYVQRLVPGFVGLSPTYSRQILGGLREAAKQGTQLDWLLVFPYLEWIVSQGFDLSESSAWLDADPDWSGAQQAVASLLEQGVPDSGAAVWDEGTAAQAAAIIAPLLSHPDPGETRAAADQMDPYTLSINSVRGEAVHAACQLLLHAGRANLQRTRRELAELLLHVAASDASPPIRAAFGRFLPWLLVFSGRDPGEWVAALLSPSLREPGPRAAFDAYLVLGRAFTENLPPLADSYEERVDLAAETADDEQWRFLREPSERLGEHLLTFYLRGLLSLQPGHAIDRFFRDADSRARAGALRWVVSALSEPEIDGDLASLVVDLCEWRLALGTVSMEELQSLASIPAPATGVADRALSQVVLPALRQSQGFTQHAELSLIAAQASQQTLAALEGLRLLILGDRWGMVPAGQRDSVRQILTDCLAGEEKSRRSATKLIHELGARGYPDFGDLLS